MMLAGVTVSTYPVKNVICFLPPVLLGSPFT